MTLDDLPPDAPEWMHGEVEARGFLYRTAIIGGDDAGYLVLIAGLSLDLDINVDRDWLNVYQCDAPPHLRRSVEPKISLAAHVAIERHRVEAAALFDNVRRRVTVCNMKTSKVRKEKRATTRAKAPAACGGRTISVVTAERDEVNAKIRELYARIRLLDREICAVKVLLANAKGIGVS